MQRIVLLLTGLLLFTGAANSHADAPDAVTLTAPDGSEVVIHRDAWGVPHIYGSSETGVFFAQGYAAAQDRLWQMEIFRRAALGRLSEISPTEANQRTDALVRAVFYTEAERAALFAQLPQPVQTMYTAYIAGVNSYLQLVLQDPSLLPAQLAQLIQAGVPPEAWTVDQAVAVTQFFMRRFGGYGGQEVDRFLACQALGPDFIRTFYPLNDPAASTTISDGVLPQPADYTVTDALADGGDCPAFSLPSAAKQRATTASTAPHTGDMSSLARLARLDEYIAGGPIHVGGVHVPEKLGSFGVAVDGSRAAAGSSMLLGAPQLGPPLPPQEPFITGAATGLTVPHEVELWDQAGDLHVGGMAIAGVPGVIIGRTARHAWTLTSGNTDNTDIYVEVKTSPGTYLYQNNPATPFEAPRPGTVRSVHGPVVEQVAAGEIPGVPVDIAIALKFTFWEKELAMATAFYDVWKAQSRTAFEQALQQVPMSFNVLYADEDQNVGYWHVGLYQDRQDGVDPRFPHLGIGTQEWQGFLPFEDLPKLMNPPAGVLANWNNKPVGWWNNGDRANWVTLDTDAFDTSTLPPPVVEALGLDAPDNRAERTVRVSAITDYLATLAPVSFEDLKATPLQLEGAFGSYSAANLDPELAFLDDLIEGDRGTYQQATEFLRRPYRGIRVLDENLVPPGQSGFINLSGELAPHFGDQWPLHVQGAFKDMLFGASFPDRTVPTCGAFSEDGSIVRLRIKDTESGIARLRFIAPGGEAFYRTLDGETVGPFGHRETAVVPEHPAELDVEADRESLRGRRPLVVQVTNGTGQSRACIARPKGPPPTRQYRPTLQLGPNRPNPFNPSTVIQFELPEATAVRLEVYDLLGRKVATLLNSEMTAGTHEATWDGRGAAGHPVAGGVYLYRLTAGSVVQTRTMTLLK